MDSPTTTDNPEAQVVFRPSKRRKQFRQRAEENNAQVDRATSQAATPPATTESGGVKDNELEDYAAPNTNAISVAEALRLRNARKSRFKGVEFRPEGPLKDEAIAELSNIPKDDGNEALEFGMSRRFAPQAGLVGELVNKHM